MNVIEIYFKGVLKERYLIESETIKIGRSQKNDIVLNHKEVSSYHAVLNQKESQYSIEDLASTNGTFVNIQKIDSIQEVSSQDVLAIGKYTIKLPRNMKENNEEKLLCYLELKGEKTGLSQLVLTKNKYRIGRHKMNEIRLSGLLFADYFAEINEENGEYYIVPLKKHKVLLNNQPTNQTSLLSHNDEIKIKNLLLKFFIEA